jgi:hypothetical protein
MRSQPDEFDKMAVLLADQTRQSAMSDAELASFEWSALATPGRLDGWTFDRDEANVRGG